MYNNFKYELDDPLEEIIEQRLLKWWGHAFRMAEESKVKQIDLLEMKVQII